MSKKKWKIFEELAAKIQTDLAPDAIVRLDQKIIGKITKRKRQIDILVQKKIGNYLVNIVIECKDFKGPLSVKQVEATAGFMQDVSANIGVIVAANGFTKAAVAVGQNAGLRLYKLIDTGNHDWKTNVTLPALGVVKNMKDTSFNIKFPLEIKNPTTYCHQPMMVYNSHKKELGLIHDLLVSWWMSEKNVLPIGSHKNIEFIESETFFLIENELVAVKLSVNLVAEEVLFFMQWPVAEISGFEDQISKKTETTRFSLHKPSLEDLKKNWVRIKERSELAIEPSIILNLIFCDPTL